MRLDGLRVRQLLDFLLYLCLFVRLQLRFLELLDGVEVIVVAEGGLLATLSKRLVFRFLSLPCMQSLLIVRHQLLVLGELVEEPQAEVGVLEHQGLVLRMDVHQQGGDGLEGGEVHGCVVDERPGLAVLVDFAADQGLVLIVEVVLLEKGLQAEVAHVEGRLHDALAGFVEEHVGVCAVAENQRQGAHQDGLTGTGFAGDDGQALAERDFQRPDNRIVLYLQGGQHRDYLDAALMASYAEELVGSICFMMLMTWVFSDGIPSLKMLMISSFLVFRMMRTTARLDFCALTCCRSLRLSRMMARPASGVSYITSRPRRWYW